MSEGRISRTFLRGIDELSEQALLLAMVEGTDGDGADHGDGSQ
jgi:hypothetical protein